MSGLIAVSYVTKPFLCLRDNSGSAPRVLLLSNVPTSAVWHMLRRFVVRANVLVFGFGARHRIWVGQPECRYVFGPEHCGLV